MGGGTGRRPGSRLLLDSREAMGPPCDPSAKAGADPCQTRTVPLNDAPLGCTAGCTAGPAPLGLHSDNLYAYCVNCLRCPFEGNCDRGFLMLIIGMRGHAGCLLGTTQAVLSDIAFSRV